ncbi:MAG: hypothetical protein A2X12_07280 [Bacteroidetes bacterium GWE2_29_8]|nr:MAG: hypothetical protein A2X12_07280 [Bacteroidetes bacterium GWE2_29_8]OFY17167.1 MAG: hypothetical protein A2X02_03480 [Bacteroidetes bacterium GWF2_29_10]
MEKKVINYKNLNKEIIIIVSILLFFISQPYPFFGDTSYFAKLATYIKDGLFLEFLKDKTLNNGNPPLYSLIHVFGWKLLGANLITSHLIVTIVLYNTLLQIRKFCKPFIKDQSFLILIFIIIADPTIITQYLIMSPDIFLLLLFWIAINAIIKKDINKVRTIYIFILLTHLKGVYIVSSLVCIDYFINKSLKNIINSISLPIALFIAWLFFHYKETNWALLSEANKNYISFENTNMFFKNIVYSFHKIGDFGRIVPIIIICFIIILKNKSLFKTRDNTLLMFLFLIPIAIYLALFGFTKLPISHRHFLFLFPLLYIILLKFTEALSNKLKTFILSIVIISLLVGNVITYPQKYGNGWDASLKLLIYFKADQNLNKFITEKHIDKQIIATKYPMFFNEKYTFLNTNYKENQFLENDNIENVNYEYFLYSNVSNQFTEKDMIYIKDNMTPIKDFSTPPIKMILYKIN